MPHSVTLDAGKCFPHYAPNIHLPSDWLPHRNRKGQQVMDDNWAKKNYHYHYLINPFMPDVDWRNPSRDDRCKFLQEIKAFKKSFEQKAWTALEAKVLSEIKRHPDWCFIQHGQAPTSLCDVMNALNDPQWVQKVTKEVAVRAAAHLLVGIFSDPCDDWIIN